MSVRKVPLVDGEYYHIYNRGNSKQKIFLDKEDYQYFINCIYCFNTYKKFKFREDIIKKKINAFDFERDERVVSIGAWVLMPNHFHIYITPSHQSDWWLEIGKGKNRISEFMRKLLTAYTLYFNKKYKRTGGLFESKFKSTHIGNNIQAKYLFSYIHLNPLKLIQKNWKEDGIKDRKKAFDFLDKYLWSSYLDYAGTKRRENKILTSEDFPRYFSNSKDFNKEILEWLEYKNKN
ncbi:MAG: transposase [Candidatus Paceibacterota bacterium]